jgi:hypothetical protein
MGFYQLLRSRGALPWRLLMPHLHAGNYILRKLSFGVRECHFPEDNDAALRLVLVCYAKCRECNSYSPKKQAMRVDWTGCVGQLRI